MNTEQALSFLKANQPMQPTSELSDDVINTYDQVRRFFLDNPDEACIPLFLNSFGEGDAHGVYQLVEDVIAQFPHSIVVTHLKSALCSPHKSVRYWCAQVASIFPDILLANELMQLTSDPDIDMKMAAVTALVDIESNELTEYLEHMQRTETDEELIEILDDAINSRRGVQ